MCVVSNLGDYYGQRPYRLPPNPIVYPPPVVFPNIPLAPPIDWTKDFLDKVKLLIEQGKKLDEEMGEPHCERPEKTEWMKDIEKRLEQLEKKGKRSK